LFTFKNPCENRFVQGDDYVNAEVKIGIRKATNNDAVGIVKVLKSANLDTETWSENEKWVKTNLKKSLSDEDFALLVAEHNHQIIGFIDYIVFPSFWECSKQGMIIDFFVHETFQGRGVGARLVEAVKAAADAGGLGELHVSTGWENTKARQFYGKHGFAQERLLLERSHEGK